MILPTSIRDVSELEKKVKGTFEFPEECKHNAEVIRNILGYANRVIPEFVNIPNEEVREISEMVAFVMRTDLIIRIGEYEIIGPKPLFHGRIPTNSTNQEVLGVLANDPNRLYPGWSLMKDEEHNIPNFWTFYNRANEFGRCYGFILNKFFPKTREMLGASQYGGIPEYRLADLTAYLLDINDLDDYRYTSKETRRFHERLLGAWREEFPESEVKV